MAQAVRPPRYRGRPVAAGQHNTRSDLSQRPRHFRGRHHAATIIVVLVLAVVGFRLFPETEVTVLRDGQALHVSTTFQAEREALTAAGVALAPGDRVVEGAGGRFVSYAVQRARTVVVEADGQLVELRTQASTVAGALQQAGIALGAGDRLSVDGTVVSARGPLDIRAFASRAVPQLPDPERVVRIHVLRGVPVTFVMDDLRLSVSSAAATVADLLREQGIEVRQGDLVHPSATTRLTAGTVVHLAKGKSLNVRLDGKDQSHYIRAATVGDVVRVLEVQLGPEDSVEPGIETPVTNGMSIVIRRTIEKEDWHDEAIAPKVVREYDASMPSGVTREIPGVPGKLRVYERVRFVNGERDTWETLSKEVIEEGTPTRRISGPSAGPGPATAAAAPTGIGRRTLLVRATWYNASHGPWARGSAEWGLTASGVVLERGMCAVDPSVIPMGTRFFVPGYGDCVAADTGGLIQGNHIDVGFPNEDDGSWWGAQNVVIEFYD